MCEYELSKSMFFIMNISWFVFIRQNINKITVCKIHVTWSKIKNKKDIIVKNICSNNININILVMVWISFESKIVTCKIPYKWKSSRRISTSSCQRIAFLRETKHAGNEYGIVNAQEKKREIGFRKKKQNIKKHKQNAEVKRAEYSTHTVPCVNFFVAGKKAWQRQFFMSELLYNSLWSKLLGILIRLLFCCCKNIIECHIIDNKKIVNSDFNSR